MKRKLILLLQSLAFVAAQTVDANIVTVTSTADSGPGTLREAITAAAAGGEIHFAPNVTGTITLTSGELAIGRALTIIGPGPDILAVSGNNASRVFHIKATNDLVTIVGLTIKNGFQTNSGGAMFNSESILTLSNCVFSGNSLSSGRGGAVFNLGVMNLRDCTLRNNTAVRGGAIGNKHVINLVRCTLSGNSALDSGGAISNEKLLTLHLCTLSGNSAQAGGAISGDASEAPLAITESTVCSNTATVGYGGGIIINRGRNNTINQSIIAHNRLIDQNDYTRGATSDVYGDVKNSSRNLIGIVDGSGGWSPDNLIGTTFSPLNPLLGPLRNNGGLTETMALDLQSAAIDQGGPVGAGATDQRGVRRPYDFPSIPNAAGGDGSDIGAYEARPALLEFQPISLHSPISNIFRFNISSVLNGVKRITYTTNLMNPTWFDLPGDLIGDGGEIEWKLTNTVNASQQYFRLAMTAPQPVSVPQVDFDSTVDEAYTNGWVNGANGGLGFGPWILRMSNTSNSVVNGFLIQSSTNNGSMAEPGIDSGDYGSWGLYAHSNNLAVAYRVFSNTVPVGATLRLDLDNGYVDSTNSVGFVLRNGAASGSATNYTTGARFQFNYTGPGTTNSYTVVDSTGSHANGMNWTDTGLTLLFTLNTTNTYTLQTIHNATTATNIFSGTLVGSGTINSIALFNKNAGPGAARTVFFNSLQIVRP